MSSSDSPESSSKKRAYVAGPLFSEAERTWNLRIATICEHHGFDTFLPQRDAGLEDHDNSSELFEADLSHLRRAHLVACNLDGHDVDAGTAWEIGYAIALGRAAVIGVRTDRRVLEPWSAVNLMIAKTVMVVRTLDELEAQVRRVRRSP